MRLVAYIRSMVSAKPSVAVAIASLFVFENVLDPTTFKDAPPLACVPGTILSSTAGTVAAPSGMIVQSYAPDRFDALTDTRYGTAPRIHPNTISRST